MASGYVVTGRGDLDALFRARVSAARAAVGYLVGGVDIANRYEKRAGTAIADTGFRSAGTDLAQLFESAVPATTNYTLGAQTVGQARGYQLGVMGTLVPSQSFGGYQVVAMVDTLNTNEFVFSLNATGLVKSLFTSITINGVTYSTASASSFDGTQWRWTPNAALVHGGSYPVTITV